MRKKIKATYFDTTKGMTAWEDEVFHAAVYGGHFTTSRGSRRYGVEKRVFNEFAAAAVDAYHDPQALLYAISASGRSVCLTRERWPHYLELAKKWATGDVKPWRSAAK